MSGYRLTVVGPGDEVLDVIELDGMDLHQPGVMAHVGMMVRDGMGDTAVAACAAAEAGSEAV